MKDILSLAVLAGTVFGLMTFVTVMTPASIGVVQTATKSSDCKTERSKMQGCSLHILAEASIADVEPCSGRSSFARC